MWKRLLLLAVLGILLGMGVSGCVDVDDDNGPDNGEVEIEAD